MLKTYHYPSFDYSCPPELQPSGHRAQALYPVVIVGAGPVGLACAIDLKQRGIDCVLIDDDDKVSVGSRAVCYAKRTLEIFDRLNIGQAVVDRGVSWQVGRTFFQDREVYRFNLLAEAGHERPAMINLQQYHLEAILQQRAASAQVALRWRQRVVDLTPQADAVRLRVESPDGCYEIRASWLIVADGARSSIRSMLGLDVEGRVFTDRFLIADVVMQADFPAERWFWFDPPFHPNQSVLLHRQADKLWRIDFQLGWDANPEAEKQAERVIPRIQAMLGEQHHFELEWVSVYTFQCCRMQSFRHGPIFFLGDAAHQVSPFGARGANSGIQDADNLVWKLARVIKGQSHESLLDSFNQERICAADENILNSTRSTDFITPKSPTSRVFRNAVLNLADRYAFARSMVNSGRLSLPTHYLDSSLNTADHEDFQSALYPGSPMSDAPIVVEGKPDWLLRQLDGRFTLLYLTGDAQCDGILHSEAMQQWIRDEGLKLIALNLHEQERAQPDQAPVVVQRFGLSAGCVWLIRPDQHLAARFRKLDFQALKLAYAQAAVTSEQAVCDQGLVPDASRIDKAVASLTLTPNFRDLDTPLLRDYQANDRFYDLLLQAHRDLSDEASAAFNARLLLILANHIGELSILQQAIEAAQPDTSNPGDIRCPRSALMTA